MRNLTCISCGKQIGIFDEKCKYCGEAQYDDDFEEDSVENISVGKAKRILGKSLFTIDSDCAPKSSSLEIFSDEEKLSLGLYPKDEGMKMSLISRILNK